MTVTLYRGTSKPEALENSGLWWSTSVNNAVDYIINNGQEGYVIELQITLDERYINEYLTDKQVYGSGVYHKGYGVKHLVNQDWYFISKEYLASHHKLYEVRDVEAFFGYMRNKSNY